VPLHIFANFFKSIFSSVCQKYMVSIYHTKKRIPMYGAMFFFF